MPTTTKRPATGKEVTYEARRPGPNLLKFTDDHYTRYDPQAQTNRMAVTKSFRSFAQYDGYELYSTQTNIDPFDIPFDGIRLDDLAISRVIKIFYAKDLHSRWPADFDLKGMIRTTRIPLGYPATMYVNVGAKDVHDQVVCPGEEGSYYKWWRGLHILCGKEGIDEYLVRPAKEGFLCAGFGFKKGYRAKVQPRTSTTTISGDQEEASARISTDEQYAGSTDREALVTTREGARRICEREPGTCRCKSPYLLSPSGIYSTLCVCVSQPSATGLDR